MVASAGGLALLRQDGVKPIGRLSRDEVREVRGVVKRSFCPQRSWFKLANYRQWPSFARMRLTFRVVDIRKDSIGIITIHPDGTRDESGVTVWYTYSGWPTNTCHLEKRNGRWKVIGRPPSLRGLTQFPPSNKSLQRTAGFRFSQFLALCPAAAEFSRWATVIAKGAKPPSISLPFPHRQMIQEAF